MNILFPLLLNPIFKLGTMSCAHNKGMKILIPSALCPGAFCLIFKTVRHHKFPAIENANHILMTPIFGGVSHERFSRPLCLKEILL